MAAKAVKAGREKRRRKLRPIPTKDSLKNLLLRCLLNIRRSLASSLKLFLDLDMKLPSTKALASYRLCLFRL
jgi:hypothetical protein